MLQAISRWYTRTIAPVPQPLARAVYSAHRLWAKRYPEWHAAFFDEHFLRTRVLQLLATKASITPQELAQAWVAQFYDGIRREPQLVAELTPIAADFLYFVAGELHYFAEEAKRPSAWQRAWLWLKATKQTHITEPRLPVLGADDSCQEASS